MVDDIDDPLSTSGNRSRAAVSVVLVMALQKTHPNYTVARAGYYKQLLIHMASRGTYFDLQKAVWNAELPWPETQRTPKSCQAHDCFTINLGLSCNS